MKGMVSFECDAGQACPNCERDLIRRYEFKPGTTLTAIGEWLVDGSLDEKAIRVTVACPSCRYVEERK